MVSTFELVFQPILKLFRGNASNTSNPSRLVPSAPLPSVERRITQTHVQAVHVRTEVTTIISCGSPGKPISNTLKKSGTCTTYQQKRERTAAMLGPIPGTTTCGSSKVQTFVVRTEPGFSTYCTVVRPKDQLNPVARRVSKKYPNGARRMNSIRGRARADSGSLSTIPHPPHSVNGNKGNNPVNGAVTSWADVFYGRLPSGEYSSIPYPTDEWDRLVVQDTVVGVEYTVQGGTGIFGSCMPRRRMQERLRH